MNSNYACDSCGLASDLRATCNALEDLRLRFNSMRDERDRLLSRNAYLEKDASEARAELTYMVDAYREAARAAKEKKP